MAPLCQWSRLGRDDFRERLYSYLGMIVYRKLYFGIYDYFLHSFDYSWNGRDNLRKGSTPIWNTIIIYYRPT